MPYANYTPDEVVERGEALYQREIRQDVAASDVGKFLVLDIETGAYEIDAEDVQASLRLLANCPEAILYGVRIGHATAYRL